MCGIAGIYSFEGHDPAYSKKVIEEMCNKQSFRGPDGNGTWSDEMVGLGAVRLHITGGATEGQQPFKDRWGNIIVFNGEIYDRERILKDLGEVFKPKESDGIALASVIHKKGVLGLQGLSGMFACAIYNPHKKKILLVRDGLGKKPLYLLKRENSFYFASTISAIQVVMPKLVIRDEAIHEYLVYRSIGGYKSAFRDIYQLPPGSWLEISPNGQVNEGRWWNSEPPKLSYISPDIIREQLEKSILKRASYTGELGTFLSGGLDSSIVAAVLMKNSEKKPTLLSIGYGQACKEDETEYAKKFAMHIGGKHVILQFNAHEVPKLMKEVARLTENPIQDPVLVTTLVLCKYASTFTKVVLTGDGSDELWGGYERFDNFNGALKEYLPRTIIFSNEEIGLTDYPRSYLDGIDVIDSCHESLDNVYRLEIANRMRNFHLARIDTIGMGCGIEIRAPFVDYNIVQLALSLTSSCKRLDGEPKGLLKRAFSPILPEWLVDRKKQPFTLPLAAWFKNELYEFANDTLSGNAYIKGFINPQPYLDNINKESSSINNNARKLWSLLQLEMWHETMIKRDHDPQAKLTETQNAIS